MTQCNERSVIGINVILNNCFEDPHYKKDLLKPLNRGDYSFNFKIG